MDQVNKPSGDSEEPGVGTEGPAGEPEYGSPGYETRDMDVRVITLFGVGLLVLIGIIFVVLTGMFNLFSTQEARLEAPTPPVVATEVPPPLFSLEAAPGAEIQQLRAQEDQMLSSYGWVDQPAGVVRIPIDRAMDLLAQRGLPARSGEVPDFGLPPAYRLESSGGVVPGGGE